MYYRRVRSPGRFHCIVDNGYPILDIFLRTTQMPVNIESLSPQELAALIKRANTRRKVLAKRKPANQTKAAVARLLKSAGWTFEELFGKGGSTAAAPAKKARKARKTSGKVAPKYRNPANAQETWSGRGRQPRWLANLTGAGRKPDEFLIK